MTLVTVTVDLARLGVGKVWHVAALPGRDRTLCAIALDEGAAVQLEPGVDAHVVSFKGKPVCAHCRRRLQ